MQLMTKEIEKRLEKFSIGSQDGKMEEAEVIVKYFNPYGIGTWLITEGEKGEDGNYLLFGYCHLQEWEWGYVDFQELANLKVPPFGLGIERELYTRKGEKVKDLI